MFAAAENDLATRNLTPRIGTEVKASKALLLSGRGKRQLLSLLEERGTVLLPQVNMTDDEQLAFTRTLGPLVEEQRIHKISLDTVVNPNADYTKGAFYWHIDGTTLQAPMHIGLLSCRRRSPVGGETEVCNTYAAYDELREADKQLLEGLQVVHMFEAAQRYVTPEPSYTMLTAWRKIPSKTLPLVWTHRSGRKSLVLGSTAAYIEGMSLQDSWELLVRMRDWATQPQFCYRHTWSEGDMLLWDNTGTMHRALDYPQDSGRLMHRSQINGDEPVV